MSSHFKLISYEASFSWWQFKSHLLGLLAGSVVLKVTALTNDHEVKCSVVSECVLGSHKMVSGMKVSLPFLQPKDKSDIMWAAKHGINYIAASFTKSRDNIEELRALLDSEERGSKVR